MTRRTRGVKNLRICGINSERSNCAERIRVGDEFFIGVVRSHHNRLDCCWFGIDKFPALTRVGTAPQSDTLCVNYFGIERIEHKEPGHAPQIEHPPRLPTVMTDIRAGHVTGHKNCIAIVRTDGGIEHGPAAAGTQNLKIPRPESKGCPRQQGEKNHLLADFCHSILSFTFDIFGSPLSGKAPEMSIPKEFFGLPQTTYHSGSLSAFPGPPTGYKRGSRSRNCGNRGKGMCGSA